VRLIGIRVLRDYLEVSCAFALRVLPYFFPSRFTIMLFYGGGSALRALLCQLWRFAPSEIIQFSGSNDAHRLNFRPCVSFII
jgi:hypothetical protein